MVVKIEKLVYGGYAMGRVSGKVIFIKNALPEEEVRVKKIKEKKDYLLGELEDILTPSPARKKPECPHFLKCGGCDFQHVSYEYEVEFKKEMIKEIFLREKIEKEIDRIVPSPAEKGYRNKSECPVKGGKEIKIGFFAQKTHKVVNIKKCLLHPIKFNEILSEIRVRIKRHRVSIYDEKTGKGNLRYVILRTNPAKDILLGFSSKNGYLPTSFWKGVEKKFKNLRGIVINYNPYSGSRITGDRIKTVYGREYIKYKVKEKIFKVNFLSFFQTNSYQFENLVSHVEEMLEPQEGDRIADLYSGVGLFGISLAQDVRKILLIEQNPFSVEDAKSNIRINEIKNAEVIKGDASWVKEFDEIDKIILDPPRKGVSEETIKAICKVKPARIVYVSCNPVTFLRDFKRLKEYYLLSNFVILDMFPRTSHIEVMGVLKRK